MAEHISQEGSGQPPDIKTSMPTVLAENAGLHVIRPGEDRERMIDCYNPAMAFYDRAFEPLPSALELWPHVENRQIKPVSTAPFINMSAANDAQYLGLMVCIGEMGQRVNPDTRFLEDYFLQDRTEIDVNHPRYSEQFFANGKTPGHTITLAMFQFVENFKPLKVTTGEWEAIIKECRTTIERDRAILAADQQAIQERNKRGAIRHKTAENPNAALGDAIAEGVARVLIEMGVVPKKGKV